MDATDNQIRFAQAYLAAMRDAHHAGEYLWPASEIETVARKMLAAIADGSFHHKGPAMRRACRTLRIKPTRREILAYWNAP